MLWPRQPISSGFVIPFVSYQTVCHFGAIHVVREWMQANVASGSEIGRASSSDGQG